MPPLGKAEGQRLDFLPLTLPWDLVMVPTLIGV